MIFARYQLATRKQQPRETKEFFQSFYLLSKDCELATVSVEEYRNELLQDAFINKLSSPCIHQQLLENNQLTVTQAFDKAHSLRTTYIGPLQHLLKSSKCSDNHTPGKGKSLACKATQQ